MDTETLMAIRDSARIYADILRERMSRSNPTREEYNRLINLEKTMIGFAEVMSGAIARLEVDKQLKNHA